MHQPELIEPEHLSPRLRWEKLFAFVPPWPEPPARTGRKRVDRRALLKACIYQRLRRQRFLCDVVADLNNSPALLAAVGFDPYGAGPALERLSAFLRDCPHEHLASIRSALARQILGEGIAGGVNVALDSCPVASWVRENNLKTDLRNRRYDKNTPPKADPDARLGVSIHFPNPNEQKLHYFWGYRNHALVDLDSELPLWELTHPNSVGEVTVAIPLIEEARNGLGLRIGSVSGDAEYDVEKILIYVLEDLKASPVIARRSRGEADKEGFRRQKDRVICPANLTMHRHGRMTVKGITYVQYRCPFFEGPKPDLLFCPVEHPKFSRQKGCNYLWRLTDDPRDRIDYNSPQFKSAYKRRTGIERVFSRLLATCLQEPSVRGLTSVRNHCTIGHITVLLVALAAHRLGHTDKIRFVRTFVPRFLT